MKSQIPADIQIALRNFLVEFQSSFGKNYDKFLTSKADNSNESEITDPTKKLEKIHELSLILDGLKLKQDNVISMIKKRIRHSNNYAEQDDLLSLARDQVDLFAMNIRSLNEQEALVKATIERPPSPDFDLTKQLETIKETYRNTNKDPELEELVAFIEQNKHKSTWQSSLFKPKVLAAVAAATAATLVILANR